MKLRTMIVCGVALGALALAPSAQAKGTMYLVGATNLVGSQSIAANGALSPITTTATGNTPRSGAITPDATKLYVSNFGGGNISGYTIGAGGALTSVDGSPFASDSNTEGLAITPNGNFLYASNTNANNVTAYSITATGTLVPVGGSPFAVPNVQGIAVSANGDFLFAATNAGVRAHTIDQTTGALSVTGGTVGAGTNPKGVAVTPDGRFLYVSNTGSANLSGFAIGADGSLTPLGATATGNVPFTVAVSPDGRFVYSANSGSNNMSAFAIGADGVLAPVSGQPFGAGTEPYGVDAAPNSRQVYVSNRVSNDVNAYDIGAEGVLSQITGSPFAANVTNLEFQSIAITPNQGPTALFTGGVVGTRRGGGGQTAEFNASSSSDPDGGTVAAYTWDFGDGSAPETTASPTISHTYTAPGDYQVTLTVTDDEGCSTQVLFTGQTVDCNGSSAARMTQTVQVSASDTAPNLKLSAKKQKLSKKVVVKAKTSDDTDAVAKGKLIIKPDKGDKKKFKLKKDKEALEGGEKEKLKPKLSRKAYKKAKKALNNRGKVIAKVNVKVTDADDDTDKDSVKVKLKKP